MHFHLKFMVLYNIYCLPGHKKFSRDISLMLGSEPGLYWQIMWRFVSPLLLTVRYNNILGYRWRFYCLQYLAIIYNGHYWSGIFSGKTEKMAAECDDFWLIFGIFSHVCYPSLPNNGK